MATPDKITLFELNERVKLALAKTFNTSYWVIAEISEVKETINGHCYLELIQKDEMRDAPKARARATIWAYTYRMLKPYFETSTNRPLSPGIKILVQCEVVFHEVFGFSLNIMDIEPTFTIGDIEQQRRETIEQLVSDGIFDMNKGLELPMLPKRVAVISSLMAAGYQDFVNQLANNDYGYKIEYKLYQAVMQGNEAEASIIKALEQIYNSPDDFDAVIIIRGGGSQADLSCFDSYLLSAHVAQFPLPVITGIGHDKDVSVVDLVAHTKLKTPTAVAEFLIGKFINAESVAVDLAKQVADIVENNIFKNQVKLQKIISIFPSVTLKKTSFEKLQLERKNISVINLISNYFTALQFQNQKAQNSINSLVVQQLDKKKQDIKLLESKLTILNPENILKRGFSMTLKDGIIITSKTQVEKGELITTILKDGKISSQVS